MLIHNLFMKLAKTLILISTLTLVLCHCTSDPYGARVIIYNVGPVPLHSVVVRVTGNSYPIGELGVLETREVKTYPTGESHVVIEHIEEGGIKKEMVVDCYFEPGQRETIRVKVTAEKAMVARRK